MPGSPICLLHGYPGRPSLTRKMQQTLASTTDSRLSPNALFNASVIWGDLRYQPERLRRRPARLAVSQTVNGDSPFIFARAYNVSMDEEDDSIDNKAYHAATAPSAAGQSSLSGLSARYLVTISRIERWFLLGPLFVPRSEDHDVTREPYKHRGYCRSSSAG